jgi:hypothetical protein
MYIYIYLNSFPRPWARGGTVGQGTAPQDARSGVRSPVEALGNFQMLQSFCPHYVALGFLRGEAGLTTLPY